MDMADEDEGLEETLAALGERETTWGVILRESSKAIALQIASPLATLVEVAVLGSRSFSELSVYTLVCAVCNLASVVFNFLSDGVAAKVSRSVGSGQVAATRSNVFYSYTCALGLGLVCFALLAGLFSPIIAASGLESSRHLASGFYYCKAATVPLAQITMASTGVLSGYQSLEAAAALNIFRACLSVAGTLVALVWLKGNLLQLGFVGLGSYAASSLLGLTLVATIRPRGSAFEDFSLFSRRRDTTLTSPLLEGGEADGGEGEGFWRFAKDGSAMMIRSLALQSSFMIAAFIAARLPQQPETLAAHGIVTQVWMATSYITDGYANVGTMIGGSLFGCWGAMEKELFRRLTERLLFCGLICGLSFSVAMLVPDVRDSIISVFTTKDSEGKPVVIDHLMSVWLLICLVQPINSLVFVYDGLVYATQQYAYGKSPSPRCPSRF